MSILHEIRNQPPVVRHIMYWLSIVGILGITGFFWISSVERTMFFALNSAQADRDQFVAQQDNRFPQPLALISKGFGSLTASVGSLFGIDQSKGLPADQAGLDNTDTVDHNQGGVYLLPLSK